MLLKTYLARDLKEALAQVKQEMGPEAVILSTQSRWAPAAPGQRGRQPQVEVVAALDPESPKPQPSSPVAAPQPGVRVPASPLSRLQDDLEELKLLIRQWLRQSGPPPWLRGNQELAVLYQVLLRNGVDETFLRRWLDQVWELVSRGEDEPAAVKEKAMHYLLESFAIIDPWETSQNRPRVWVLLGPTGVGKTTTIAKLASYYALDEKRRVGLISLDHQRLGAQSQLAAFSRIAGLPLVTASQRQQFAQELLEMQDMDLILVDTAGRNPLSPDLNLELAHWLAGVPGLENHLVISSTACEGHLDTAIRRFGVLPLNSAIVTKVDEDADFAGVFNQLCRHRLPLSYLTTGQQVPDDIEPATRRRVRELLLRTPEATWGEVHGTSVDLGENRQFADGMAG